MDELLRWISKHSQVELAKGVGVTQGAISQWLQKGHVPTERVRAVERVTRIPAGVLRPDHFGEQVA